MKEIDVKTKNSVGVVRAEIMINFIWVQHIVVV